MKKQISKKKKITKKHPTKKLIKELEDSGELNPSHRREFDQLLDDASPPIKKK